jgi:LacI family transcriptional regulator/LacI family purine nucleotide synthesis repressor
MSDIAERLGISKNSVSLALNNKPGVSEALRKKIVSTATELNYGGFSVQDENKSKCIAVIVPEYLQNDTFFYSDVFWAIERESKKQGCLPITFSVSHEAEANLQLPSMPKEMNIIGLLVIGVVSEPYLKHIYETGFPVVTVDIAYQSVPVNSICSANISGAYTATRYLAECGHAEIGFIGPIHAAQSVYERWCGFQEALGSCGLKNNPDYNIVGAGDRFELLDTTKALEPYLDRTPRYPTAWFCAGDRIAIALINLLSKKHLSVPDDVSVIGYDDIPISQMISPPLTTIRVNRKLMGRLSVERLIALQAEPKSVEITNLLGTLVVRESVGRPADRPRP